jgi:hypothetical protein
LDVIVDDRFAFECIVVIGSEEEQGQQVINNQITKVNSNRDDPWKKGINKERVCLFTPNHPICKPDKNGKCPPRWGMNEGGNCFPIYIKCPRGYWRADDDESGACVPRLVNCIQIYPPPLGCRVDSPELINGTLGGNVTVNGTSPISPGTNRTSPTPLETNATEPISPVGGGSGGGVNQSLVPEPLIECPEGEQLALDGLSCEPIFTEEPIPIICGEGEELIDGQCQVIPTEEPTEEDTAIDEEDESESEEQGGGEEEVEEEAEETETEETETEETETEESNEGSDSGVN